jgi:hypothetical protein
MNKPRPRHFHFPPLNDGSEPNLFRSVAIMPIHDLRLEAGTFINSFKTNASISARTASLASWCAGRLGANHQELDGAQAPSISVAMIATL